MREGGVGVQNIQKKADLPHTELTVKMPNYVIVDLKYG